MTNFSFLEGASHPEEMVLAAKAAGLSGIGVADRNTVAGVVKAHVTAKEHGFAFMPGARLLFADDTPDILAFPQDREGWGRLCRMLTAGNLRTHKGDCRLYESDLMEWGDGMMLAVAPDRSRVLCADGYRTLCEGLQRLKDRFSQKCHLALSPAYDGADSFVFASLNALSEKYALALIATNQPLYHKPERRPLADIVTAIREHVTVAQAGFRLAANAERYLKNGREMARLLAGYPQAIANTAAFFAELAFTLDELEHNYPDESVAGETHAETLRRLTWAGAHRRYPRGVPEKVAKLIEYELDLVAIKKYEPYFLTVHNIVNHARYELEMLCQGRGSAANSAICFCLGVTEVDPETSTLLFERFISTEREEPPDIDVDFEHARREEIIQYIYRHYGREHVGLTAAVASYRARSAGREVAKVFGLSDDVQSALSGAVWGWSSEGLSEREAKAAGLDISDPTTLNVLSYCAELMNFPRHLTQHVGGFVITRDRLDEVVPLMNTAMDGRTMIEWNKDDIDALGFLKIDVLALGMLTCLAKAFDLLALHYDEKTSLADLNKADDGKVYDMICRADTIGVFQIESRAQMSMLPRLRPREFYDLVIEVAIVRPGPIQGNMVHPYLKRREDLRRGIAVVYEKPELEEVLKRTLGVPLFQEQAMQIAITAAKFSPDKADKLRRSMATFKRTGKIEAFRKEMVDGMVANDYPRDFAERCFSQIEGFGEYGFPESHAASFALLVYASCWVKTYYPDVFCTALLNSQPMGFYPPAQLVRDAREHGVEVRAVDINHSRWDVILESAQFSPRAVHARHASMRDIIKSRHAIRLGFRLVKGLSLDEMGKLVKARTAPYRSVRDLWLRSGLSRSAIENLADADAFRSIGLDRRQALWAVRALDASSASENLPLFHSPHAAGDDDLQPEPFVLLPDMPKGEQVIEDYRSLTLSLKAHPVSFLRADLSKLGVLRCEELDDARKGSVVTVAGLVLVRQRPGSAKGVIFMTVEDETGVANAIIWPKVFDAYRSTVMGARLVRVRGRLQREKGVIHVVADHVEDMTSMLGLLQKETRTFGASSRDEVLNPPAGHPKTNRRFAEDGESRRGQDVSQAMPSGRNFH